MQDISKLHSTPLVSGSPSEKIFDLISRMASVRRFSNRLMIIPENVLQHTAAVGIIALDIVSKLDSKNLLKPVGIGEREQLHLFKSILTHDMDEVLLGDIPRPTKYALSDLRELLHKVESRGMELLLKEYGLGGEWLDLWGDSKKGAVGAILVVSDLLSVTLKCWEESHVLGNRVFKSVGDDLSAELVVMSSLITRSDEDFFSKYCLDPDDSGHRAFLLGLETFISESVNILGC